MKSFMYECLRVLKVTKRPDRKEFGVIVKVSGLGMLLIGLIGFTIQMIKITFF
ncbi:MAG: protein translocase SEC61 complex subunit gamma [Nanoarchaeota archaeon]|nr:protein translocase SEC61 complex subunit gamma [Nanoarchaeota archaeon]